MNWKILAGVAMSFAAGIGVAFLFKSGSLSQARPPAHETRIPVPMNASSDVAALREDYERKIAALKSEIESLRMQGGNGVASPIRRLTRDDAQKYLADRHKQSLDAREAEDTAKLSAAGFSPGRVEWLMKRGQELATEYRKQEDLARQQGKFDINVGLAHYSDPDIDLRREIGDDEYTRYREALGRGIGLPVGDVEAGGIGEAAGLKAGDQIVTYNGTRVYSLGDLNPLMSQYATSGMLTMDVLRDGKKIRLNAAGGMLRIRQVAPRPPGIPDIHLETRLNQLDSTHRAQGVN